MEEVQLRASSGDLVFRRAWPIMGLTLALVINVAWIALLGFWVSGLVF